MTRNNKPARRAFVPGDPDTAWLSDDVRGPSIWAAREVRREQPDLFGRTLAVISVATAAILALVGWAFA